MQASIVRVYFLGRDWGAGSGRRMLGLLGSVGESGSSTIHVRHLQQRAWHSSFHGAIALVPCHHVALRAYGSARAHLARVVAVRVDCYTSSPTG